ncbi:MAG: tyrosine--tRNA ligase [Gemmatimonadota bacterium]
MDVIRQGVAEIVPEDELARKLEDSRRQDRPLCIKQGFDPTRPDLHIGHAVSIRKLRDFQDLGHQVVFVVGDYTARVGDPSGRSEARPRLTPEEIDENAHTYAEQVSRILDLSRVRLERNSRWLAPLDLADILELTASYTVARMLERDDFAKRYAEGRPISVMEFLYPLMQAYDSVALKADVELGGTDQKFNLLVARTIQERYGQVPQACVIMPLLRGTDGEQKMSKSYDNYIGITEAPEEQFGKAMSIPDTLLDEWLRLATSLRGPDLSNALAQVTTDPYAAKRTLARAIVQEYHGAQAVEQAGAHFDRLFKEKELPDSMPELDLALTDERLRYSPETGVWVPGLVVAAGLAGSNNEAIRLVEQGAVRLDGDRVQDRNAMRPVESGSEVVVQRGKRRFARVRFRAS